MMAATIIIGAAIVFYAGWVIWRRAGEIRAGKYCGCSCEGCSRCKKTE